jgi:hypothetical protein
MFPLETGDEHAERPALQDVVDAEFQCGTRVHLTNSSKTSCSSARMIFLMMRAERLQISEA